MSFPDDERTWVRLADAFAGRGTPGDRVELERWLDEHPGRRADVEALKTVWDRAALMREAVGPVDVRAAWAELASRLEEVAPRQAVAPTLAAPRPAAPLASWPRSVRGRWSAVRVAAAVAVIGGAAWMARTAGVTGQRPDVPQPDREVATGTGQRAVLRLDDGTHVVLGVGSTLRWGRSFGAHARDVHLTGEALFTVAHESERPFRVHAGDAVMEDLGTEFSVRKYPGDDRVTVAVRSGQVRLGRSGGSAAPAALLEPGDLGTLSDTGAPVVRHGVDLGPYLAFAEGRLVFVNTPLREAIAQVQRWYDVQIMIADSSLERAFVNATFRDDPLPEVLDVLAASLGARYEQRGRMVWLRAR